MFLKKYSKTFSKPFSKKSYAAANFAMDPMTVFFLRSRSGMSLIQVLVGSAIGIVAFYLLASTRVQNMKVSRRIELRGELEGLRQTIRDHFSCKETTGNPGWDKGLDNSWTEYLPCDPGKDYTNELKNKRGKPLFFFEPDGSIRGVSGYTLRATCVDKSTGIVFEYQRQRSGRVVRDPISDKPEDWANLFGKSTIVTFCQEQFGQKKVPEICADDEVLVDIAPDGEPKCRKAYSAADFQLCIQFSDHACRAQPGEVQCTPCTGDFADENDSGRLLDSPWTSDANYFNPDCGRLFTRRCIAGDLPIGEEDIWSPLVTTRRSCSVQCADNEIMIGFQVSALPGPSQSCSVTCAEDDVPIAAGALVANIPSGNFTRPECPAPIATGKINSGGSACGSACTKKLKLGKKFILDYIASLDQNDPLKIDPVIRQFKKNSGNSKKKGRDIFNQIKDAAFILQCDPFVGATY